ncbi:winged helix-turn-helix transcriptional regulator [Micromonospora sp. DT48]|uniref:winged helix-turn-helix transcriptional regulator n=1 Tax=Micromonospora sp. DT48 TaxID=3393429 RepID=UPI003CE9F71D
MKEQRDRRTYGQQCGLAFALDVVGERWTLLIIRELLVRPRRYRDLLDALPGIGTNLLADRLAFLTEAGITQPLDAERRTAGYALTELGEKLREPVLVLARFGLTMLAQQPGQVRAPVARASWAVLAIESMVDPARALVDEVYEFDIEGEVFHVRISDGDVRTVSGSAGPDATLRVATDARTFFDLGSGTIEPVEAVVSGVVSVTGPAAAVPRCLYLLGLGGRPGVERMLSTAGGAKR